MDLSVQQLSERLNAGETDELRRDYRQGDLRWLAAPLGAVYYQELGARIDGGDVRGIRSLLHEHGVEVPSDADAGATAGSEDAGPAAPGWLALLPLLIALAIAAVAITRCGQDRADGESTAPAGVVALHPAAS